jgi:hypothetical protein
VVKQGGFANTLGSVSVALVVYFWLALLVPHVWHPVFAGAGWVLMASLIAAVVMSAIAGYVGSARWYFATALAVATFLFVGFRMH